MIIFSNSILQIIRRIQQELNGQVGPAAVMQKFNPSLFLRKLRISRAGRSSDLLPTASLPGMNQWPNLTEVELELTASGNVQDLHLIPF